MLLHSKKIAIIGGGPGGLTLARLLQIAGADVKVYERDVDRSVRVQGATLDLHEESGLEALRRAGLIKDFEKNYRPNAGKLRITDGATHIFLNEHATESSYAEDRPEIDRGPLRQILLDSLAEGTVVWDSQFTDMTKQSNGWLINLKNGSSAYADIVIAADGANSKLRSYVTDIQPVYSGITIVEGNVYHAAQNAPQLHDLVQGGKVFSFDRGQSIILSAKGDGSLSFYTGCPVEENWAAKSGIDFQDKDQVHAWFRTAFSHWADVWQELFASTDVWCIARPQYHYPLDQSWESKANITLLGDAAHRMPPYAGEGVNMAMQDAFELAECLTQSNATSMQEAIATYEKSMLKRASEITSITLANTEMLHSEGAIQNILKMMQGEE